MSDVRAYQALLRTDFFAFVHRVFVEVVPGATFNPNWHLEAICYALVEAGHHRRTRQIIEVPPRSLKSICASVALVAWLLGQDPTRQILCVSYSGELAIQFSAMTRQVMKSEWYRALFPGTVISSEKDTERLFRTTAGGFRDCTSVGGTLTGKGGSLIIIDDPAKPDEVMSEAHRETVKNFYDRTLISRLNNKRTDTIIVVAQRLHPDDLPGHLKRRSKWDTLTIPAIATGDERIQLGPNKWHQRRFGEVLDEVREPIEVLNQVKLDMGSRDFNAQYQQDPLPADGGIIDFRWFQTFDQPPERRTMKIVQSWDCASKDTEYSDFSVCTTWGIRGAHYYLLDVFRKKLNFPDLERAVIEQAERWEPKVILIEDAAAGIQLHDTLRFERPCRMPLPIRIKPQKDKITRLHAVSPAVESGRVSIPLSAPWIDELRNELVQFPSGKYDDQVDSISQFLDYAERQRLRGPGVQVVPMFGPDAYGPNKPRPRRY